MGRQEDNNLIGLLFVAGLSYLAGTSKLQSWQRFVDQFNERLRSMKYAKIIIPIEYLKTNNNARVIYHEAVLSHLFGLPNASVPIIVRLLELALRSIYAKDEAGKHKPSLNELIQLAEKELAEKADIAHGFRLLRNRIHGDTVITEQDSLETLRHVSILVNQVYPWHVYRINKISPCGHGVSLSINYEDFFVGNSIPFVCSICRNQYNETVIP